LDINKFQVLLSPDACKTCRAKTQNGQKIFTEAEFTKDGYGHRPPFHPNCVLGDTVVDAPDASNLLRVKYSGKIIKISLADGRTLSVTQNHIILTDRGFARADLLSDGDYVISSTGIEGVISKQPNDDSSVSTISEIFDASIKSLGSSTDSVPPTPEHLHGDGRFCDSNIDIVSTDSLLGNTFKPRFYKHIKKYFLDSTHLSDSLNSGGNLSSMLITLSLAFDGIVSGSSISSILRFSSSTMNELKGLFNISRYNSRIDKASTYSNSTNSKPMSDTILALSSVIRLDKIVNIEVLDFNGYVYDISTVSSLYITNGIISSNCYCVAIPSVD
jgi:intein/homing endonuclease